MKKEKNNRSSRKNNKKDNRDCNQGKQEDHEDNRDNEDVENDTKNNHLDHDEQDQDIESKNNNTETEKNEDDTTIDDNDTKDDDDDEVKENINNSPSSLDIGEVIEEIDQFISNFSITNENGFDHQRIQKVVEQFADLAEDNISNYSSSDTAYKWSQLSEDEESSYLDTVNRLSKLQTTLSQISSQSNYASYINHIGCILQRSMSYLEDEFRSILEDFKLYDPDQGKSSANEEPEQKDSQTPDSSIEKNFPGYSNENISKLKKLIEVLMLEGYDLECYQIYFITRRNAIEESLSKQGFEKHSIDDLHKMHWESMEKDIATWIRTFKDIITITFPNEKRLIDTIFNNYTPTLESLFHRLMQVVIIQLLNFAEAVSMKKHSSEKLFKLLDVYETLRDQIPTMDGLCLNQRLDEFKQEAFLTRNRLGESMIYIFAELENSIKADMGKTPILGGAVHPLTRYTMNYLKYAYEYKDTLEQVFEEHSKIDRDYTKTDNQYDSNTTESQNNNEGVEKQSRFQYQSANIILLLETNLEAKSKLYKDPSLSLIFLMNNGRYILQKIKGSAKNKKKMMADDWCKKRSMDLRNYHKSYQRETWGKVLQCLNPEGLIVKGKVSKPILKERFKSFNSTFDEIHKTQSTWVVCDEQLQSELRVSISAVVTPAYRSFLGRFKQVFTPGRQVEKYVKFQPEDVENCIDNLFDGNATSVGTSLGPRFW